MSDRPADRGRPGTGLVTGPLWFFADRDAFLRRFVLRTLLEPPRARRPIHPIPSPLSHPIPSPRPRGEG
jgi:hypothetical protein